MTCPDDETFAAFTDGSLAATERAAVADHASGCESCHALISSLVGHLARATEPTTIERYQVVRRLGAGAMGVVYEARDPELDRSIAIKLLRPGASADRLRREAQALAKLTHPNVVGVYDVGPYGEGTFVAMALVDGATLRTWSRSPHTTAEIVDVIIQTARGVAAAHAAGIVHRDLKPDNIFIGHHGEVRVGDFGLARSDGAPQLDRAGSGERSVETTQAGTLLGTPAYMAPEQASGEASAASDQFSLCVTAWEALHGTRPFERTIEELLTSSHDHKLVEGSSKRRIPRRIDRALRRGLAATPETRHASIAALIAAMSPRHLRWPVIAASVVAIGIVAIVVAGRSHKNDPCADPGSLAMVWSPVRREQLVVMLATIRERAPGFSTAALHAIDSYVADWTELQHQSCVATQIRHDQAPEAAEHVTRCLDRGATIARRLIDSIGTDPNANASHLLAHLEGLEPVERCLDVSTAKPSPALEQLQARLAELGLDERTTDAPLLGVDVDALVQRARATGDAGATAEALLLAGMAELGRGETSAAERQLRQAMTFSDGARDDRTRARAAAWLVELLVRSGRLDEASTQRDVAASARERGGKDPLTDELVEHATASIARAASDAPAEVRSLERILELEIAHHGSASASAIASMEELAYAMQRAGDPAFRNVLDRQARAMGQVVASSDGALDAAHDASGAAVLRGDFTEAVRQEERAAAIALRAPNADTPMAINDLALMYEITSDFVRAQQTFHETVGLVDAAPAELRNIPALVDALEGEARDALVQVEIADTSQRSKLALATAALASTERALQLANTLGDTYAGSVDAIDALRGRALVALARWKDALPILRAALDRGEAEQPKRPFGIAMRSFLLARVLWEIGDVRDRDHARALGAQAAAAFADARELFARQAALVSMLQTVDREAAALQAWRTAHP